MRLEIFMAITTWQEQVFPNATATSKMKHLQEEVKEVLHELEQPKVSTSKLLEEYADCLFLLYGAVNSSGFSYDDMQLALIDKFEKNLQRKWGKPDERGVVKHIEQPNNAVTEPCDKCTMPDACRDYGCWEKCEKTPIPAKGY